MLNTNSNNFSLILLSFRCINFDLGSLKYIYVNMRATIKQNKMFSVLFCVSKKFCDSVSELYNFFSFFSLFDYTLTSCVRADFFPTLSFYRENFDLLLFSCDTATTTFQIKIMNTKIRCITKYSQFSYHIIFFST